MNFGNEIIVRENGIAFEERSLVLYQSDQVARQIPMDLLLFEGKKPVKWYVRLYLKLKAIFSQFYINIRRLNGGQF